VAFLGLTCGRGTHAGISHFSTDGLAVKIQSLRMGHHWIVILPPGPKIHFEAGGPGHHPTRLGHCSTGESCDELPGDGAWATDAGLRASRDGEDRVIGEGPKRSRGTEVSKFWFAVAQDTYEAVDRFRRNRSGIAPFPMTPANKPPYQYDQVQGHGLAGVAGNVSRVPSSQLFHLSRRTSIDSVKLVVHMAQFPSGNALSKKVYHPYPHH
jgi:hypothetical protein